ncbi:hypothetical protein O181_089685 [Austropuccinia psidii MF-1]|uniref:Uncharacterized protein n=1 Tax=Austropuccinia psidii MF-1 TaxID=1389203 RepID=A0A9Q3IUA5_9BASI|nr:hypothetical protein [Austropuccinia psidii MF-1]
MQVVTTTKNDPPQLVLWQSQPENQVGANWPHHILYGQLAPSGALWPFGHNTFSPGHILPSLASLASFHLTNPQAFIFVFGPMGFFQYSRGLRTLYPPSGLLA